MGCFIIIIIIIKGDCSSKYLYVYMYRYTAVPVWDLSMRLGEFTDPTFLVQNSRKGGDQ